MTIAATQASPAQDASHGGHAVTARTELEEFRASVRRMVDDRIRPHAAETDRTGTVPEHSRAAFREMELAGLAFPEELGGSGADLHTQVIAVEEVARGCASSASILLTPWAALTPVAVHADPALAATVVPGVARGDELASFCLTEPTGGTDLASLRTRAERVDGGWLLNGQKRFISNAGHSTWYAVLARSGADSSYGVFLVHAGDEGLGFGKPEEKMGFHGFPTADVHLDDVFVPDGHVVGDPARGYQYMMDTLTYTRPLVAAQALGIAQAALDEALAYTAQREQFGQSLSRFQLVRAMVADMATAVAAGRALLHHACDLAVENTSASRAAVSMAKLFCSDTAMSVTTTAVQLHGGNGYMRDYTVERLMRDAKVTQIWEGANELQKMLVAKDAYAAHERR
ncbi:acyl-CoA dehydrogenase family protein [Nocardioides mangrovi]|uniref:Acyl-CoA dehydrogenase family protein n=1 Tax=Nocardioides mangrovi TaxID=2874580 RepID=A0ABS7UC29_9ACTN|nr:acyl-CoA dehydrogenase family protein [Nocardioides mangrovi]MBZ5738435.1 acyl-CoA dehydrogenase family protein [Nocardioides mangrovi]